MKGNLIVDFQQVEMLGGLANAEVKEIFDDFLDSLDESLGRILLLFQSVDAPAIREESHKLKGAAKMCGFAALGKHFELLENKADEGILPDSVEWIQQCHTLTALTRQSIDEVQS